MERALTSLNTRRMYAASAVLFIAGLVATAWVATVQPTLTNVEWVYALSLTSTTFAGFAIALGLAMALFATCLETPPNEAEMHQELKQDP